MRKIVDLQAVRAARDTSTEQAWQRFVEATMTAKVSLRLEDGIAAGKAYREFVERFVRSADGRS